MAYPSDPRSGFDLNLKWTKKDNSSSSSSSSSRLFISVTCVTTLLMYMTYSFCIRNKIHQDGTPSPIRTYKSKFIEIEI